MTEPAVAWAEAFVAAQSELPTIAKSKEARVRMKSGGEYQYSYADLQAIVDKVRPILKKHGLAFAQDVRDQAFRNDSAVAVCTRIFHVAGHVESFGPVVLPVGGTPQETGSAITYARRYGLTAALGLVTDEDDDAQIAQKRSAPRRPRKAEPAGEEPPPETPAYGEGVSGPEGSSSAPTNQIPGHKPGCVFPGVSEFRKDETTRMPQGRLRCTGCDASLKESDLP